MMRRIGLRIVTGCLLLGLGLSVTGVSAASSRSATCRIVYLGKKFGNVLVAPSGRTLYYFTHDSYNKSACSGACARLWPPFMLPAGVRAPVPPKGLTGKLGSIARGSGRQVTYEGRPLYTYSKDTTGGQARGQGIGHVWFVMRV